MNIPSLALTLLAALDPSAPAPAQPMLGAPVQASASGVAPAQAEVGDPNEVRADAIQDFRGRLSAYGNWIDHPSYGTLWIPSAQYVGADFVPYTTGGYWAYGSDYVWNSTYAFSDAPFHYGRWTWVSGYGWGWVPGAVYRGAWVTWRTDPYGYVGWAPLGPSYFWYGGNPRWVYGYASYAPYSYCHRSYLFAPDVGRSVLRGPEAGRIAGRATIYAPPAHEGAASATRTLAAPTLAPQSSAAFLASPSPTALGIAPASVRLAAAAQPTRMAPTSSGELNQLAPPRDVQRSGEQRPGASAAPLAPRSPITLAPVYRGGALSNSPPVTVHGGSAGPSYTPPNNPSFSRSAPPSFAAPSAPSYSPPSSPSFSRPAPPSFAAPSYSPPGGAGLRGSAGRRR